MGKNKNRHEQKLSPPENTGTPAAPPTANVIVPTVATPVAATPEPKAATPVAATPEPKAATPVAVSTPETASPEDEVYKLILANLAGLSPEQRAKAEPYLTKLKADADKARAANAAPAFNTELEAELPKWLEALAKTHGYSLAGRKITVVYPKVIDDKTVVKPSNTPVGTKVVAGTGNGHGFPSSYGEALLIDKDGKEVKYDSPSKLASSLGLQITGQRDMIAVFTNPLKAGTKDAEPRKFTVDASREEGKKHFTVRIA